MTSLLLKVLLAILEKFDDLGCWAHRNKFSPEEIRNYCAQLRAGKSGKVSQPDSNGDFLYCRKTDPDAPELTSTKLCLQDFVRAFGERTRSKEGYVAYRLSKEKLEALEQRWAES